MTDVADSLAATFGYPRERWLNSGPLAFGYPRHAPFVNGG
jgi:hypothetical protein